MPSKLGPHVLRMNDQTDACFQAGPTLTKFAGEWGASAAVPQGKGIIGRRVVDQDAQSQRMAGRTPAEAAYEFVHTWGQLAHYGYNPAIGYWEGHNEPVWHDEAGMAWYAETEIERMKLTEAEGFKCVVGNFATGTPPLNLWTAFLPACQYARDHGHVLGVHEYSVPFMWWMTGKYQMDRSEDRQTSDGRLAGDTTLRYRQVYDQYLIPAGLGDLSLVITESGIDPMATGPKYPAGWPADTFRHLGDWWNQRPSVWGYPLPYDFIPVGGWHFRDRDRFYFEQLWWYDQHLRQDNYVIGATIFTYGSFGNSPWRHFDVTGTKVADYVTNYIKTDSTIMNPS